MGPKRMSITTRQTCSIARPRATFSFLFSRVPHCKALCHDDGNRFIRESSSRARPMGAPHSGSNISHSESRPITQIHHIAMPCLQATATSSSSSSLAPRHNSLHSSHRTTQELWSRTGITRARFPAGDNKTFERTRRRFSTSPLTMHGHLTPPNPGEE